MSADSNTSHLTDRNGVINIDGAMKTVQINLDDALLAELDADDEVQRDGRDAVLGRAARAWLVGRRHEDMVTAVYTAGYRRAPLEPLGPEFGGWEAQGVWPE